jgi:Ca2+-binding EF-hand superfamily protein
MYAVLLIEFAKVVGGKYYMQRSQSEIVEKFKQFDKDGNGTLNRDEVLEAMKHFRGNYSRKQVLSLLNEVDKNGDKAINING